MTKSPIVIGQELRTKSREADSDRAKNKEFGSDRAENSELKTRHSKLFLGIPMRIRVQVSEIDTLLPDRFLTFVEVS